VDRLPAGQPVVCDDCRFPNEADTIRAAGGYIVRVERPGAGKGAAGHSSEQFAFPHDCVIDNVGSLTDLHAFVDRLALDLSWAAAGTR
jgi:hypothetical protein